MSEWASGDHATWMQVPRGGWGIPYPVHVRIDEVRGERARVIAPLKAGGTKKVWVNLANLRRPTPAQIAEQLAGEQNRMQSDSIDRASSPEASATREEATVSSGAVSEQKPARDPRSNVSPMKEPSKTRAASGDSPSPRGGAVQIPRQASAAPPSPFKSAGAEIASVVLKIKPPFGCEQ